MSINRKKLNKIKIIFFRAFKGINWKKTFSRDKTEEAHARSFERMTQKECKLMCMGTSHFVCTQKKNHFYSCFQNEQVLLLTSSFFLFLIPEKKNRGNQKKQPQIFRSHRQLSFSCQTTMTLHSTLIISNQQHQQRERENSSRIKLRWEKKMWWINMASRFANALDARS